MIRSPFHRSIAKASIFDQLWTKLLKFQQRARNSCLFPNIMWQHLVSSPWRISTSRYYSHHKSEASNPQQTSHLIPWASGIKTPLGWNFKMVILHMVKKLRYNDGLSISQYDSLCKELYFVNFSNFVPNPSMYIHC